MRSAAELQALTRDAAIDLLALGLDPKKATLFVQSDVPETTELAWLLTSVTPMSWLEKCVSYKDKVQQGLPAEHGLFGFERMRRHAQRFGAGIGHRGGIGVGRIRQEHSARPSQDRRMRTAPARGPCGPRI